MEKRDLFVPVPAYETLPVFTGNFDESFTPIGISPHDPVSVQNEKKKFDVVTELPAPLTENDIPRLQKVTKSFE